jgi:eukaryotic-like serine/threonine-protein kinase
VKPSEPKTLNERQDASTVAPAASRLRDDPADFDDLVGQIVADRYRVESLLGTGGMGTVYRAQHVRMRKTVALKVLHRPMLHLPEMVARFEREAIAAARIDHPNVAGATDFGRLDNGSLYLVLEYVEGLSLRRIIAEAGALSVDRALGIARQIALALGAAHATGVVHRDLKPDNVMLVSRGEQTDVVKVLDFGIAKLALEESGRALTQMGSVFGTPEYMSPEQASGQAVDYRTDFYSLGIVLYQMLTGRLPFVADEAIAILAQQITADPPSLPDSIPQPVDALVKHLMAKDAERRPLSAEVLCAQIDELIVGREPAVLSPGHRTRELQIGRAHV